MANGDQPLISVQANSCTCIPFTTSKKLATLSRVLTTFRLRPPSKHTGPDKFMLHHPHHHNPKLRELTKKSSTIFYYTHQVPTPVFLIWVCGEIWMDLTINPQHRLGLTIIARTQIRSDGFFTTIFLTSSACLLTAIAWNKDGLNPFSPNQSPKHALILRSCPTALDEFWWCHRHEPLLC